ncbi:hypothetical protein BDB00DRAFT_816286 [Zychaea mexicana]|uniref:uncharacterized protein n=1 Tax=Zychaea mexicana TaxID=64656 RepID=UPI0022FE57A9|nr:uncharacterized protein BDB00DRAFT_816286 [Zychaea mexicana]KAI9494912.1 hypothetical protein BDB00DRAFT_816286 [Zychaea mexicana]
MEKYYYAFTIFFMLVGILVPMAFTLERAEMSGKSCWYIWRKGWHRYDISDYILPTKNLTFLIMLCIGIITTLSVEFRVTVNGQVANI